MHSGEELDFGVVNVCPEIVFEKSMPEMCKWNKCLFVCVCV